LTASLILFALSAALSCARSSAIAAESPAAKPPAGHSMHGEAFNEGPRQKAYRMLNMGNLNLPVTTASADAQAFFNQGVAQLHGFWYFESERSFRQTAKLDPNCAMAYWGMAMSNLHNESRAKGFIAKAVERKSQASRREQLWIDSLAKFWDTGGRDQKTRYQKYIRDLETIIQEFPEEVEAKAFLSVVLWHANVSGVPINSRQAVNALLDQVFAVNPLHPAHHYRIHLWDEEKPAQALASAAVCGESAAGIAHLWHMPGHIYDKLRRYGDAAWQQEASARVDHAHMYRDRVMPYQIHNYAHNNEWCSRNLTHTGRVRDALELAKNLCELPRHPKHNNVLDGGHAAGLGRQRLFDFLLRFELWEEVLALADTFYLDPTDKPEQQVKRLKLLGAAYFGKADFDRGQAQLEDLKGRLRQTEEAAAGDEKAALEKAQTEKKNEKDIAKAKTDARRKHEDLLRRLRQACEYVRGGRAVARGQFALALQHFGRAGSVPKELLSFLHANAGEHDKAVKLAKEAADNAPGQAPPLANYVYVLFRAGKNDEAAKQFDRLRTLAPRADLDVPVFARLTETARSLGLPQDWRIMPPPAADFGKRPDLDTLGPFRWMPYPAESWTLTDGGGKPHGSEQYRNKPVVVIFYLGHGCLHCVEQLNAFAPKAKDFQQAGIELVAVSTDPPPELKVSIEKCTLEGGFPFPLVSDANHAVFKSFRAYDDFENAPLHGTFLIDAQGYVRWQDISHQPFKDPDFLLKESKRLLSGRTDK
jgi:peroxiredoxin/Tfp pilus assembly protein PilF